MLRGEEEVEEEVEEEEEEEEEEEDEKTRRIPIVSFFVGTVGGEGGGEEE